MSSSTAYSAGPPLPNTNEGPWVLGVVLTIRALAVIIVAVRLYARLLAKHTAGWDDVAIAVAACLTFFGGAGDIVRVSHGWGRHSIYIPPPDKFEVEKWSTIGQLTNFISLFFMRLSVCLFTLRLLPVTLKWPRVISWGALVFNAVSTIINCVVFTTRCTPIKKNWDYTIPGHCLSVSQLNSAFGTASGLGVIVDFVVVCVPLTAIRHLQMNRKTKIGISIIISLGLLTSLCSIGKMIADKKASGDSQNTIPVFLFSTFEEDCGIICASMPAMRQLYKVLRTGKGTPDQPSSAPYYHNHSGRSDRSDRNDPMRSPLVNQGANAGSRNVKSNTSSRAREEKKGASIEMTTLSETTISDVERQ